jgi:short-subunit dehydrogenase
MTLREKYGQVALVAGASEGIGAAFATRLAAERMDLFLVARRAGPLEVLANRLAVEYGVKVIPIACDLADPDVAETILQVLDGREVDLLVYNAALSPIGPFLENGKTEHSKTVQVNILSPLSLLHVFGGRMVASGKGAVILMASLAGFQGSGFLSMYASTKAFTRVLGESLWYEWKDKGVDVIACCAGATLTPGYIRSDPEKAGFLAPRVQRPEEIPAECFKRLGKQPSFIAGRGNRIASFFMQKILPRKMAVTVMGDNTRKMYRIGQ